MNKETLITVAISVAAVWALNHFMANVLVLKAPAGSGSTVM